MVKRVRIRGFVGHAQNALPVADRLNTSTAHALFLETSTLQRRWLRTVLCAEGAEKVEARVIRGQDAYRGESTCSYLDPLLLFPTHDRARGMHSRTQTSGGSVGNTGPVPVRAPGLDV